MSVLLKEFQWGFHRKAYAKLHKEKIEIEIQGYKKEDWQKMMTTPHSFSNYSRTFIIKQFYHFSFLVELSLKVITKSYTSFKFWHFSTILSFYSCKIEFRFLSSFNSFSNRVRFNRCSFSFTTDSSIFLLQSLISLFKDRVVSLDSSSKCWASFLFPSISFRRSFSSWSYSSCFSEVS